MHGSVRRQQRRKRADPSKIVHSFTGELVELARLWILSGPYVPDRWGPRVNGPQR